LAHDVNRWWHKVRGKEDPYLKIGEVNDRTKPVSSGSKNRKLTTGDRSTLDSGLSTPPASVLIRDIRGKKSSSATAPKAQSDWVYALKDVSFEVKREELRTLGRSEKEISKKCLGATKVPDSWRRRHQLLGIIGRNGAGNQAAG
jgi:hypothetical protein